MKKMIILNIIFLLNIMFILSEEIDDVYPIDKSMYGINKYELDNDNIIYNHEQNLSNDVSSLYDDHSKYMLLNKYFNLLDDTLIGNNIETVFCLFVPYKVVQNNLIGELNKYTNNLDKNDFRYDKIKKIISKLENWKSYTGSQFNFFTNLHRKNFDYISILLPDGNWNNFSDTKKFKNLKVLNVGEENYAGILYIDLIDIKKKYKINNDKNYKNQFMVFKNSPNKNNDYLYRVNSNEIKLIAENYIINNVTVDKIYEQITSSSEKYNFQILVDRKRFYIIKNKMYVVGITQVIGGNHIMANRLKLIQQSGFLLDSVLIIQKKI